MAAKEKTGAIFSLAALSSLPETRIRASGTENRSGIGAVSWLSSTLPWGCRCRYGTTASGPLVREKFGTYSRDSYTGLDYADQRWFTSTYGRFNTADPYKASAAAKDPGSWNRYAYVVGDPIDRLDETGLDYTLAPGAAFNPADPRNVDISSITVNGDGSGGGYFSGGGDKSEKLQNSLSGAESSQARVTDVIECASDYAQQNSLAAVFGQQNNPVGNAILGNTVAGIADIFLSVFGKKSPDVLGIIAAGPAQGLPIPNVPKGVADLLTEFVEKVGASGSAAAAAYGLDVVASTANLAKLAFDSTVFITGIAKCY